MNDAALYAQHRDKPIAPLPSGECGASAGKQG